MPTGSGIPVIIPELVIPVIVVQVISNTSCTIAGLVVNAGEYIGWGLYVQWHRTSIASTIALPQGEQSTILTYDPSTNIITFNAFTIPLLSGDKLLLINPNLSVTSNNSTEIKAQTDKLAGEVPVTGATAGNWQTAETDIFSIGIEGYRKKIHDITIGIQNTVGNITLRMYKLVNGIERQVFPARPVTWSIPGGDAPGINIISGTYGIHGILRVTAQSNNAADNGAVIEYDYMEEKMFDLTLPTLTRYEWYDTNNVNGNFGALRFVGQQFTPSITHTLKAVYLRILRALPGVGNLVAVVRTVDPTTLLPTGPVLSSGYIPTSSVAGGPYALYQIVMSDYILVAGTMYALYFTNTTMAIGGMAFRYDTPVPSYSGGSYLQSDDGGVTWTSYPAIDMCFQEWGVPL